jgi:hypothetical protein
MSVSNQSGKVSIDRLGHIKKIIWDGSLSVFEDEPILVSEDFKGFKFDYLWSPSTKDQSRLFVLFSGDAQLSRNKPPVFQRWSWASKFPGHCLFVSDPSCFLDERLGLAWYAGTSNFDPMPHIIEVVHRIAAKLRVDTRRIFAYGSSGGGFAALRMTALNPLVSAVVVNPQINVTQYQFEKTDLYLSLCFEGRSREKALRDFPTRLNLVNYASIFKESRIIYMQNKLDHHHYKVHFSEFCKAMDVEPLENKNSGCFRRLLFSHEGGHRKAETPDIFDSAMCILENDPIFQ